MEIPVVLWSRTAEEVVAVRYMGDPDEAHMLIARGWLDSCDVGFGRNNAGSDILRGHVGDLIVFPGDVISFDSDWILEVWEKDMFVRRYEDAAVVSILTDAQPTRNDNRLSEVPTGQNNDAVRLDTQTGPHPVDGETGAEMRDPIDDGDRGQEDDPLNRVTEPVADEEERAKHGDTTTDVQVEEHAQPGSQPIGEPKYEDPPPDPSVEQEAQEAAEAERAANVGDLSEDDDEDDESDDDDDDEDDDE